MGREDNGPPGAPSRLPFRPWLLLLSRPASNEMHHLKLVPVRYVHLWPTSTLRNLSIVLNRDSVTLQAHRRDQLHHADGSRQPLELTQLPIYRHSQSHMPP